MQYDAWYGVWNGAYDMGHYVKNFNYISPMSLEE